MIKGIIFDWIGTLSAGSRGGVYPYSEKVLKYLKDKKIELGLISIAVFGIEKRIMDIKNCNLAKYFTHIKVIEGIKLPEHYLECMERLNTNIKDTAIIGDSMYQEIRVGNQLGCATYWVTKTGFDDAQPGGSTGEPSFRIDTVEDLLNIL